MASRKKKHPGTPRGPAMPPAASMVVGLGASAGGLAALTQFLEAMPRGSGMAFVVISHLDPAHESALPEILSRATAMPVDAVRDGMAVEPDHVFVIPPNTEMVLAGDVLNLAPRPASHAPPMPVDAFFRTLAVERKGRAVGVVFSGTGSDGTQGLKAIKGEGGITFAQDHSAQHSGMPRSAVASGAVDFVLSPAGIAAELARIGAHPYLGRRAVEAGAASATEPEEEAAIHSIIATLSRSSGVDFTHYKYPTLRRRIERRLILLKMKNVEEYIDRLRNDPEEPRALLKEVLIPVTGFFRDPEVFEALKLSVLPQLLADRPAGAPVRVWVPGCSTGEEIYSLAICLLECLGDRAGDTPVKLFGTDISEDALAVARRGFFPASSTADIAPQRLRRYFSAAEGGHRISKDVRDRCVFARHDVTSDPPFSNLDLVSCRNLLIYLGPVLQDRVLPIFHHALGPSGVLVLGNSETVGAFTDLFAAVDAKHKIFRRTAKASRLQFAFASAGQGRPAARGLDEVTRQMHPASRDVQREADRLLLERYVPAGVVVDENLQVVQYRGRTGLCLEPAPGAPSDDLMSLAREGLSADLRDLLRRAGHDGVPVRREGVRVKTNSHWTEVHVEVIPFADPSTGRRHFAVSFEPAAASTTAPLRPDPGRTPAEPGSELERQLQRLERELATARSQQRGLVEEHEAASEELKAANEEIVSSNEELQSTNEELEAAKEELQATNEELVSVNDELKSRIQVVSHLTDDLINLIDGVNIPTLVVQHDLCLGRFSPTAQRILNLLPTDVGRPLGDFKLKIDVPDLGALIRGVIESLETRQLEVTDEQGRWHRLCVRPYKTSDNRIDGAVITLVDIDAMKRQAREIEQTRDRVVNILETQRQPLIILRGDLSVESANRAFYETFRTTPVETENRPIYALGGGRWDIPRLRTLLEEILPQDSSIENLEVEHDFPLIGHRSMILNARRVVPGRGESPPLILLAFEDVTERRRADEGLLEGEVQAREQRRIGQELHDGVGQELTGLGLMATALVERLQAGSAAPVELATRIRDGLERVHADVRALSRGLIPVDVDTEGLRAALEDLASRTAERSGIRCVLDYDEAISFPDTTVATHIYRIVQEAVSNALRHGHARRIAVSLRRIGGNRVLTIQDDGSGFPASTGEGKGVGVRTMQFRAGRIGAVMTIQPGEGGGTCVTCTLPGEAGDGKG